MLNLNAYGEEILCDRAEKGTDYIKAYLDGELIQHDSGITDFSGYILTDESGNPVPFSAPEPSEADRLRATEAAIREMAGEIYG